MHRGSEMVKATLLWDRREKNGFEVNQNLNCRNITVSFPNYVVVRLVFLRFELSWRKSALPQASLNLQHWTLDLVRTNFSAR